MKKLMFANVIIALLSMVSASAFAASNSWAVNASGNWVDAGNWTGSVVPGATGTTANTDTATFSTSLTTTSDITVDAGRNVKFIVFGNPSTFGYNLTGNPLLLTNGGTIISNATGDFANINTISSDIQIQGNAGTATFTSNDSQRLLIGAVTGVSTGLNLTGLTLDGTSVSTNNKTGVIDGRLAVTKVGTGTWTLSGNNTYTGSTTVFNGRLIDSGSIGNSDLTVSGRQATFDLGGGHSDTVGTVTLIANGTIAGSSGSTLTSNAAYNLQQGLVSAYLAGTANLTKTTVEGVILTGDNSYVGATLVNEGTLRIENGNALGDSIAGTTVAGGATLEIGTGSPGLIIPESLTINGQGVLNAGALDNETGNNTITGQITLGSDARIETDGGSTLTLDSVTAITGSGNALSVNAEGNTIINSSIATGTGTLTKDGIGILELNGANTYTGLTTITAGTVKLGNANGLGTTAAGTTVSATGAALDLNGQIVGAEAVTLNGTGVGSSGALYNSNATLASLSGLVTLAGDSTITSTGSGGLTFTGGINENGKTLTLNGAAGTREINVDNNAISGVAGSNLVVDNVTVNLNVENTYIGSTAIINGATLNANATDALPNSVGGRTAVSMDQGGGGGSTLVLSNGANQSIASLTGEITSRVILVGNLTIGAADLGTTTFAGVISGEGSLTKDRTNTLTLSNSNTYGGKTTIADGTLSINNVNTSATANQSLGTNAAVDLGVAITSSGILNYTGAAGTLAKNINVLGNGLDTIQNNGTGLLTLSGNVVKDGTVLTLKGGNLGIDVTGTISGSSVNSDLIIDGGTTTLSAANTYIGPTSIINGATLNANALDALPTSGGDRTAVSMDQTGIGGSTLALVGFDQSIASLTGVNSSRVNLNGNNLTIGTTGGATTFAGIISGAGGSLTKDGASTQVLSGENNYTGTTTISAGTLQAGADNAFSAGSATTLGAAGTLDLNDSANTINALAGAAGSKVLLGSATLTTGDATNTTFAGVISETGNVIKQGTGILTLSGTNTYTGTTTINAGTLQAEAANSFSAGSATTLGAAGTLDLNNFANRIDVLAGASGSKVLLDAATLTTGKDATNSTFAGVISETGNVIKQGTGILTLSGTNTYTGTTTINAGTLQAEAANSFSAGSATTVGGTGTLDLNNFANRIDVLIGEVGSKVLLDAATLTTGKNAINTTFAGVISETGNVIKQGTGSLTLSGANTYTGNTDINAGTLIVDGSIASSLLTSVNSGGTLAGSGTTGEVIINSGGILSPGNSPGTLTSIGATYGGGGTYLWQINNATGVAGSTTGWDLHNITPGALNISATSGNQFTIDITGLNAGNTSGKVVNFNKNLDYTWRIASATGGVNGFSADKFNLATARFIDNNSITGTKSNGSFSIVNTGNDLVLLYTHAADNPTINQGPVADAGTINSDRAILNNFTGVSIDRVEKVNMALRGLAASKSISSCDAGLWVKGFGSYLSQSARDGIAGYNAWNAGTALGVDHCFSDALILGISGGYAYGNVNSVNNDNTVINSAQTSVYGGYQDKIRPFFIDTALTFAYNWQVGRRNIIDGNTLLGRANANYNGQQYGAYVGGGYSFNLTDTIRFTPLASLQYNNMHLNGYTESGAGALNLTIASQNYNQLQSGLGARISTIWDNQWGRLTPEVHSKWLYDFFGDPFAVTSNFNGGGAGFGTNGAKPAVNSFNVGGELKMEFKKAEEIAIIGRVDTQIKEGFSGVFGSLTIRF